MSNKIILGGIGVVVVAGIVLYAFKGGNPSQVANNASVYCSSDGTLSGTMPIQSHRSYCIKSDSNAKTYAVHTPSEYSFSLVDDHGTTLKNFEITHTKPMHVIVVRKDLKYFQHIHPKFNAQTGEFSFSDLTFPADGEYRIVADFAPAGGQKDPFGMPLPVTLSEDVPVGVGARYTPAALGSEEKSKTFDGMQVTIFSDQQLTSGKEVVLTFDLKQGGKAVTDLDEYLGALGHAVVLREGTLDFIHAHPMEDMSAKQSGTVDFMVNFPQAGTYKIFTQFERGGKVITTDFIVSIAQGTDMMQSMPGMDHSKRK